MRDESEAGHPTDEKLTAWVAGQAPTSVAAAMLSHVRVCAPCWQRWAAKAAGVIDAPTGAPEPLLSLDAYDFALQRAFARVEPPPPRVWTLADRRTHWAYSSALLDLSNSWRDRGDLDEAHECAYIAVKHAELIPDTGNPQALADLRCRTWCELANLRRSLNDLDGAEDALCKALNRYEIGSRYPPLLARWRDVAASLFRDQGRFDEAIEALEDACETHLEFGYPHLAGRSRVNLGSVYLAMGQPRRAAIVLLDSYCLLDREDTGLVLAALHSTLYALAEAGEFEAVAKLLWTMRPLYEKVAPPKFKTQLLGLEAKVAAGQGYFRRAERLYRQNIAAHRTAGRFYDAAVAALEFAAFLVERGRPPADVLAVLNGAVRAFVKRQIYRELLVCFKLLRESIQRGRNMADALASFAREVRAYSALPGVMR